MKLVLRILITFTVFISLAPFGCTPAATPALIPLTLQLNWTHQAQFAGFYAADQQGVHAAISRANLQVNPI